jgi:PAS domain-containing protein
VLTGDILSNPQNYAQFENENIRKNGEHVWINWTNRAITDENGEIIEILAIGNDITERKKAENELKAGHDILEAVILNIGVGIVVSDPVGNIISMNPAALNIHEFKSEHDRYLRLEQFTTEYDLEYPDGNKVPFERWPLTLALKGEFVKDFKVKLNRYRSNTSRNISYNSIPVYDRDGNLHLIVMTLTDFTDIQESEQKAVTRATEIEAILSCIADGVLVYDKQGRIRRSNSTAEKL